MHNPAIPELLYFLCETTQPDQRRDVIDTLLAMGADALPDLVEGLAHPHAAVRRAAAEVLWTHACPEDSPVWIGFEHIEKMLSIIAFDMIDNDMPSEIPYNAVVFQLGNELLLDHTLQAHFLQHTPDNQLGFSHPRLQAYFAAVRLHLKGITRILHAPGFGGFFKGHPYRETGKWDETVLSLANLMDPDNVVLEVLEIDPYLAAYCIENGAAVSATSYETVIERLLGCIEKEISGRWVAVDCLGRIGNTAVAPRVLALLEGADREARQAAETVFEEVWKHATVLDLVNHLQHEDDRIAHQATAFLVARGLDSIPDLVDIVRTQSGAARRLAAEALVQMGAVVVPSLLHTLYDRNYQVRVVVAGMLGNIGSVAAVPDLLKTLADPEAQVRAKAARALARIGDPHAIPALTHAMHDPDPEVRKSAAAALEKIGVPSPR